MTRLIEVKRIPVTVPFDYVAAKAEYDDAVRRGDDVIAEQDAIVIRTKVFIRERSAA